MKATINICIRLLYWIHYRHPAPSLPETTGKGSEVNGMSERQLLEFYSRLGFNPVVEMMFDLSKLSYHICKFK